MEAIGALYAVEAAIREQALTEPAKRAYRLAHAKPVAERFFAWIDKQFAALGFLPSSPFIAALAYIRERRAGLEVYLDDPAVSIDTNLATDRITSGAAVSMLSLVLIFGLLPAMAYIKSKP